MSDKRVDYITWDEYFMGVAALPADGQAIQVPRWGHVL